MRDTNGRAASHLRESDDESEIDDGDGPAGQKMKQFRVRLTTTMHKDLSHASTDHDASMGELALEGLRYILYGVQPRHVGVLKKRKQALTA